MKIKNIITILVWIIIAFIPGAFGALFTAPNIQSWYITLNQPVFTPPSWLFGPVWTLLYISMGVAATLIWEKRKENKMVKAALVIFFAQLFINGLWSMIFFGQHQILQALFQIILLWFLILATIIKFYQINTLAGLILIPYLLWVSFAALLNYSFWTLNR
ncbi:MAG: tryptophan-rich sensory protein [Candidatus Margulisbacteria bacterium]|nr:tryptophan-rich sensory protein [Candidatus Margulisiibacteriota bacterium]MBU1022253.1 tryptophan-rich sensory protein [Candidatus Margulisiibacteriota bacterium]MBU1729308.1 tryptophan-rich sensory protein [Candidatus Margulisiibacteriota bacterium]MBU1955581.1 tryptophan-rich sensory protein [Candidatus Margulisiibacteriota bacterium]